MTNAKADWCILLSLAAWAASCVHPPSGILVQFLLISYLVCLCEVKGLPALMLLMLDRGNVKMLQSNTVALHVGVTLTPVSWFVVMTFAYVVLKLLRKEYDNKTSGFALFWLFSSIPATIISFTARANGLVGIWSSSLMDFFSPAVYFWGISMGKTYSQGREYFVTRLGSLLLAINFLCCAQILYVFSFEYMAMAACLGLFLLFSREVIGHKILGSILIFISVVSIMFTRYLSLQSKSVYLASADLRGDTLSRMAVYMIAVMLSFLLGKRLLSRGLLRVLPILMVAANLIFVSFVITIQKGNKAVDADFQYETFSERVKYKIFGDRGRVWLMGWEQATTPPYIFKDLRAYIYLNRKGEYVHMLLPHNQFLTLLARNGWWQGLVLAIFIIWIQVRACRIAADGADDFTMRVMIPTGLSIYFIIGITGQSVLNHDLLTSALACSVFPGLIYGHWRNLQRMRWMSCAS